MGKRLPYFKWYAMDATADEFYNSIPLEAVGLFHILLNYQWANGTLPADLPKLSRLTGISTRKLKTNLLILGDRFAKLLVEGENRLANLRLRKEMERNSEVSEIRAYAGKKGGDASAEKRKQLLQQNPSITEQNRTEHIRTEQTPLKAPHEKKPKKAKWANELDEILSDWVAEHGKRASSKMTADRRRVVVARLEEDYTVDQIKKAIRGIKRSKNHNGDNPDRAVWMDLFHVCKNAKNVDSFIALHEGKNNAGPQKPDYSRKPDVGEAAAQFFGET